MRANRSSSPSLRAAACAPAARRAWALVQGPASLVERFPAVPARSLWRATQPAGVNP